MKVKLQELTMEGEYNSRMVAASWIDVRARS